MEIDEAEAGQLADLFSGDEIVNITDFKEKGFGVETTYISPTNV